MEGRSGRRQPFAVPFPLSFPHPSRPCFWVVLPKPPVAVSSSAGRNEDSVEILRFWYFFVSRNPRNLRPGSSSLVSTSLTHSGDDEDSEDSGIIQLFFFAGISGIFPQNPAPKRLRPALVSSARWRCLLGLWVYWVFCSSPNSPRAARANRTILGEACSAEFFQAPGDG